MSEPEVDIASQQRRDSPNRLSASSLHSTMGARVRDFDALAASSIASPSAADRTRVPWPVS